MAGAFSGHGPCGHPAFREDGSEGLYGIFDDNMKKYRAKSEKIGGLFLKDTSNTRYEVEKGCCETPSPCLLQQVTETAVIFCFSNIVQSAKIALNCKQVLETF